MRPLEGLSILVVDEDVLGAFRVRRALVQAGARVAAVPPAEAAHYLCAPELSAVVIGTALHGNEAQAVLCALQSLSAPKVAYGTCRSGSGNPPTTVPEGDLDLLRATLQALCSHTRR